MAKGKKEEKPQQNSSKTVTTTEYKKSQRLRQGEADRLKDTKAPGWAPKKSTEDKHRCADCGNPSAVVRQGLNKLCVRCQGEPARARLRQKAREVKEQPRVAQGAAR